MAKENASTEARSNENPAPTLPDYESFHVTACKEMSNRVMNVLRDAEIRINETVWHEIGRSEYIIEVHRDDLVKAGEAFAKDLGSGRTITNHVGNPGTAS